MSGESHRGAGVGRHRSDVVLDAPVSLREMPAAAAARSFATSRSRNSPSSASSRRGELAVEKGATVLVEGSHSAHLYTVLSGWGFRYKLMPDGRRQILNYLHAGRPDRPAGQPDGRDAAFGRGAVADAAVRVRARQSATSSTATIRALPTTSPGSPRARSRCWTRTCSASGAAPRMERAAYLIAFICQPGEDGRPQRQGARRDPDHPAAYRRHARPVAGPHQQDDPQADRPQAHRLARRRLRGRSTSRG